MLPAAHPKKAAHQRTTFLFKHAGGNFQTVIQALIPHQIH